jgi:head-tail adaptor
MAEVEGPFMKPRDQQLSRHTWRGDAPPAGTTGPWELGETCWWARVRLEGVDSRVFSASSPEAATAAAHAWIAGHPRATA